MAMMVVVTVIVSSVTIGTVIGAPVAALDILVILLELENLVKSLPTVKLSSRQTAPTLPVPTHIKSIPVEPSAVSLWPPGTFLRQIGQPSVLVPTPWLPPTLAKEPHRWCSRLLLSIVTARIQDVAEGKAHLIRWLPSTVLDRGRFLPLITRTENRTLPLIDS